MHKDIVSRIFSTAYNNKKNDLDVHQKVPGLELEDTMKEKTPFARAKTKKIKKQ